MASSNDSRRLELDPVAGNGGPEAPLDSGIEAERFEADHELRLDEIVLTAASLETTQREAFLHRIATDEPDLFAEAQRRLQWAAELPTSFLSAPAADALEAPDPKAETRSMTAIAASIERYEIQERLGEGGMARVYKAFDRHLRRPVALKLLKRAEPRTLQRFLREAQAQACVRHEYVLTVHETGELGDQPYIAMQYVNGPTLMETREQTTLDQKIRLMAQAAEGLHAAHREGLVHRDVKPSNILVEQTPDGKWWPWVADFGIAMVLDGGSIWSAAHAGTPYYVAPERLGDERDVDVRSDVYSLGVTLYQFLCGHLPFDHPSLGEMLRQVREDEPKPLRERDPSLPAELEAVTMKCLAKLPEQRYATAREVADDLWRFLDGETVKAHDTTYSYRFKRSTRKRFWLPAAVAIAGLLVALLSTIAVSSNQRAQRAATEAVTALDSLAQLYRDQGRFEEAEELYMRNLVLRREHLGNQHPSVAQALLELSELLQQQGKYAEAETRAREGLGILTRTLPEDHWRRGVAESVLGASLVGLGQFSQAETLLLSGLESVSGQTSSASLHTLGIAEHLIRLYEAWGREELAEPYRTMLSDTSAKEPPADDP
ncbi:MAG: protein kinase [Acidobacteriota bacterium]